MLRILKTAVISSKLIHQQIVRLIVQGSGADAHGIVVIPADAALIEILIALPVKGEEDALLQVGHANLGDAQARRLRIRVNGKDGKYFAHTLNNTVVAPPRMLIAFLENNLQADGSIRIPEVLRPYMGGMTEIR